MKISFMYHIDQIIIYAFGLVNHHCTSTTNPTSDEKIKREEIKLFLWLVAVATSNIAFCGGGGSFKLQLACNKNVQNMCSVYTQSQSEF